MTIHPPLPKQFTVRQLAGEYHVYASFGPDNAVRWCGPYKCPRAAELARERHADLNRITREWRENMKPEVTA